MAGDFFDPTPEQQNVTPVDATTLHKAERLIESCEHCHTDDADIPVDKTRDRSGVYRCLLAVSLRSFFLMHLRKIRRYITPKLKEIGLGWVNFQVLLGMYSSRSHEQNIYPKVTADQLGHSLDVNLSTYTKTSMESRINAVTQLESALVH
jgi:hypothetical protein